MLERRFLDLSTGIRMSFLYKQGDSNLPPIIFLHGHLMTSDALEEFALGMDYGNTIIIPDLRPSWHNVPPDFAKVCDDKYFNGNVSWEIKSGHTIEGYADDIVALVAQMGLNKPYVFGGSLGSAVTLALSKKLGDNISGIALICPVMRFVHDFQSWIGSILAKLMARTKTIEGCAKYVSDAVFPHWLAKKKWFYEMIVRHNRASIVKSSDAIIHFNARKFLGLGKTGKWVNPPFKYMVVYGTKDGLVYPYQVEVCKSIFDLEVGKNLFGFEQDHNLPYYMPDELIKILGDFIAKS